MRAKDDVCTTFLSFVSLHCIHSPCRNVSTFLREFCSITSCQTSATPPRCLQSSVHVATSSDAFGPSVCPAIATLMSASAFLYRFSKTVWNPALDALSTWRAAPVVTSRTCPLVMPGTSASKCSSSVGCSVGHGRWMPGMLYPAERWEHSAEGRARSKACWISGS